MSEDANVTNGAIPDAGPEPVVVFQFLNEKQRKVRDALAVLDEKMGPKIAAIYEGILAANSNKRSPDRLSQVSHSVRELTSVLPLYFPGLPQTEKRTRLTEILTQESWRNFRGWFDARPMAEPAAGIAEMVSKISAAIEGAESHGKTLERIMEAHPSRTMLPAYQREAFAKNWIKNNEWFIALSHHAALKNGDAETDIEESEFQRRLTLNDDLLYQALVKPPFFEALPEIDRLLSVSNPSPQEVDDLIRLIAYEEQNRYFFQKCDDDTWLEPLDKRKAFAVPREPVREENYIRFLPWPESGFLARVANKKPNEVIEIISKLETKNHSVHADFVAAALASPAEVAAKYVNLIEKGAWLDDPYRSRVSDRAADLIEKLATDGRFKDALRLAKLLFDSKPSPRFRIVEGEKIDPLLDRSDAKSLYGDWEFGRHLEKKTAAIADARPVEFFGLLADRLHKAIEIEAQMPKEADGFNDYSYIWRPRITKPRRAQEDVKDMLLDRMIDLADKFKDKTEILRGFVGALGNHKVGVFRRLELHLYAIAPSAFSADVERTLADTRYLYSYGLRKELILLLRQNYSSLAQKTKDGILALIDGGNPALKPHEGWSLERIELVQKQWKAAYLNPLKEYLPPALTEKYSDILKGEWSEEGFLSEGEIRMWSSVGGQTPALEIEKMEPADAIEFLGTYAGSEDDPASFSESSLGQSFGRAVTKEPKKFAAIAGLLLEKKLRPTYVYHFLGGLGSAAKDGRCFEWEAPIDLCEAIAVAKKGATSAGADEEDWSSVRKAIAGLLRDALGSKTCQPPVGCKEKIWAILFALAADADPSAEDENNDNSFDPLGRSINTVRGEAMHAIVNYGLWCARNGLGASSAASMPKEVREVLDAHLDTASEHSLAIRSVYGWRLPNISYLDVDWVKANIDKIFPEDEPSRPYFSAAIQGVLANGVFRDLAEIIKDKYRAAIDLLGQRKEKDYRSSDIDDRLPEHLMVLYVSDERYDDTISYFFGSAPAKARAASISYLGRQTLEEIDKLPDPKSVKLRLLQLWRSRLVSAGEPLDVVEELRQFGWWFRHDIFEMKTAIELLAETLEKTKGSIEVTYRILEELPFYVDAFPLEVITCLAAMAHGANEGFMVDYEEQRDLIARVKKFGSPEAMKKADELINYLGERGFIGLGDLLK